MMEHTARKILLIEDDSRDASRLRQSLEAIASGGYHVEHVERLAAGLERLGRDPFDLVLLDLSTPDVEGLEALGRVQAVAPGLPVVTLSDEDDPRLAAEAVRAGAQDCLIKGHVHAEVIVRVARYAVERNRILCRLREVDQLKSKFVSTVSHEMRTPLTIIREFVSLVHDGVAGPVTAEQVECLQAAIRNCDRATDLINDLLELSRIEAGKLKLTRCRADLPELVEQCRRDLRKRCEEKRQSLRVDLAPSLRPVLCDRDKIHQVLVNLVANAHKFTPEGGTITISAAAEESFIRVSVDDTGIGISPEDQRQVFDAFTQIGRRHGPGAQGTGLGLTISRNIVRHHGGTMTLDSEPGRGSRFSFTLPVYEEGAELPAFVEDRWRLYRAMKKTATLVLLRSARSDAGGGPPAPGGDRAVALDLVERVQLCAEETLRRRRDEMLLVRSSALVACMLESEVHGSGIALRRLATALEASGIDPSFIEFSLTELKPTDPDEILDGISRRGFSPLGSLVERPVDDSPKETETCLLQES